MVLTISKKITLKYEQNSLCFNYRGQLVKRSLIRQLHMDPLPGNAPFVLSAMTPALLVDTHPTLNLAVYQRAPLPIICQHLLCDARALALLQG